MGRAANPSITERRFARRAATRRKAVVICANPATPLFTGTAVDISREGLGLRAYATLPLGTAVDLEVEPREDSETDSLIRVSGFVARCEPAGSHVFALGVQFRIPAPLRTASNIATVRKRTAGTPATIAHSPEPKRDARLSPWLAILTAILLFLLWWPFEKSGASADHRGGSNHPRKLAAAEREPVQESKGTGRTAYERGFNNEIAGDSYLYDDGGWNGGGDPGESLDALFGMGGPGEFASLSSEMEGGEPGPNGDAEGARRRPVVRSGKPVSGAFPRTWPTSGGGVGHVRSVSAENRSPRGDGSISAPPPVHLEVNRDTYELIVFVDGDPLWRFPVGLGRDGSTPSGDFTIHNKIAQPDWYHRGESVSYGDPQNPLGESWMGLARDGTPLSYGIHPTGEPDSIGGAKGAGCIRMRPEDAETLFRYCPLGATVHIGEAE